MMSAAAGADNQHPVKTVVYLEEGTQKFEFIGKLKEAWYDTKDVTKIIQSNLRSRMIINNNTMAGDPAPGTVKSLKLVFEGDAVYFIPERCRTILQGKVKTAEYGAGQLQASVVEEVNRMMPRVAASNADHDIGKDPARGRFKWLKIVFSGEPDLRRWRYDNIHAINGVITSRSRL
ncbi:unnamed protein product [Symbiodinium natans]|uniref:Uncharacterized protein n=1 Tax=Symbiodinium natans TaxID=878477 RepID=A0A812MQ26_9DINO|nr:unnamed protein product [Symbiodinium natans]